MSSNQGDKVPGEARAAGPNAPTFGTESIAGSTFDFAPTVATINGWNGNHTTHTMRRNVRQS